MDYTVWALSAPADADLEETWVEALDPDAPTGPRQARADEIAGLDLGFGQIEIDVFGADLVSLKFPYAEADARDALAGRVGAVLRALHGRFGWRVYDPLVSRGATRRHRSLLRRFSRRP
jgi:hypothetical protein